MRKVQDKVLMGGYTQEKALTIEARAFVMCAFYVTGKHKFRCRRDQGLSTEY